MVNDYSNAIDQTATEPFKFLQLLGVGREGGLITPKVLEVLMFPLACCLKDVSSVRGF